MKRKSYNIRHVSPEQFVREWQIGVNLSDIAKKLGMRKNSVSSRARFYRKNGVPLKALGHPRPVLNQERLKKLTELARENRD